MEHERNGYNNGADIWHSYCAPWLQINRVTSPEPGKSATSALDVSATGNKVLPFFIFRRAKFRAHFLNGAPACSQGAGTHPGWMKAEHFVMFVEHFVSHVKPSRE
jgi:hypothetical protein